MQLILKDQMGTKPTSNEKAYITRFQIANKKTGFFTIFGISPRLAKTHVYDWNRLGVSE